MMNKLLHLLIGKNHLPILLLCLCFNSCNSINRLYVPLGDSKKAHSELDPTVSRIYLDRQGLLYPGRHISNQTVREHYGLLNLVYKNDTSLLGRIAGEEGLSGADLRDVPRTVSQLQSKLTERAVASIDNQSQGREIVFIIHGFNDHPDKPRVNGAAAEYGNVMETIDKRYPARKFHYVHVFWDGMSVQNGSPVLKPFNAIKIWDNAQVSAAYAGLELRRVLSGIDAKKMYVITHSHGAAVITNALFNVIKFPETYYKNAGPNGGKFIVDRYNDPRYETPTQEVFIGMLAPAIPGMNVFDEYSQRTINGKNDVLEGVKNYHFVVGFNSNDVVTSKFYTNPAWYGTTTLASRRRSLNETLDYFNDRNVFDFVDFSRYAGKPQRAHSWFKYMSNKPPVETFLDKVMR